jgi:hypothetical protein
MTEEQKIQYLVYCDNPIGFENVQIFDSIEDAIKEFRKEKKNHIETIGKYECKMCKGNDYTKRYKIPYHIAKQGDFVYGGSNKILWLAKDICGKCFKTICKHEFKTESYCGCYEECDDCGKKFRYTECTPYCCL